MIFEASYSPDSSVELDSKIVQEVANILINSFEKTSFVLQVPDCFDDLNVRNEYYKIVSPRKLQPLRLIYSYNVVTSSVAAIFVHTKANDLAYTGVDDRAMMQYLLFKFVLEFNEVKVYIDEPKEEIIDILDQLKERAEDFRVDKAKMNLLAIAIVNVGYFLNLEYPQHMTVVNERNGRLGGGALMQSPAS